ncbi:MAG: aspartate kinase [Deltaproteobacteria bacterium RIFCSPLOWO2_02_FULL_50_16]|nr:MAG: aspartate kinase [Deltaproteobacteria bacterium RIFCSPHIGHO2_02_FULL_50_15]OGQ57486.1 MAG: aspartate kinase [Deltaproteobacteria bacterium RIFCSPLOWO2_02_FULL_50_16]
MSLVVQKYGGTSVGDPERIRNVARRVLETQKKGHQVVVVVSAMSGETNRLLDLATKVAQNPVGRESDVLVATGEQVTIALLSLAIQDMGGEAISFLAHQLHILTDSSFMKARIKSIDSTLIHQSLNQGKIAVVAGFQGIDPEGNITTLGRGGSDTSAVALAVALKADDCEIYTDVDGVYTTDPRICPEAKKLDKISYEEMLEMASLGSKVLQTRSVELAAKYKIPLWVKSSFNQEEGTVVTQEDKDMEKVVVAGITQDLNEAKISVRHLADQPGIAARLFQPIAENNINVDMIVQNVSEDGFTDITFTVPKLDLKKALEIVQRQKNQIGSGKVEADEKIAKISIVGVGMRSHAGVAGQMFKTLAAAGINIQMISTSEIKISVVIEQSLAKKAVQLLHQAFELGKE